MSDEKKPGMTVAEMIRDPETAQRMYDERVKYFQLPQVQRALKIEKAEKEEPKGKPI